MNRRDGIKSERFFLKSIHVDAFGGMANRDLGPFASGMNVVYGPNESGKSSMTAFVEGVLFGWEDARGRRNTYRPQAGERCGTLTFEGDGGFGTVRLSRSRNADGLRCSGLTANPAEIVGDVDRETFKTVFSLDGDELRSLKNAQGLIQKLLSAGSGSSVSPADVGDEIDRRIAGVLSRSAAHSESIPNIQARLDECREKIGQARCREREFLAQREELACLERELCQLREDLREANAEVERTILDCESAQMPDSGCVQGAASQPNATSRQVPMSSQPSSSKGGKASLAAFAAFVLLGLALLVISFARSSVLLAIAGAASFMLAACAGIAAVLAGSRREGQGHMREWASSQRASSLQDSFDASDSRLQVRNERIRRRNLAIRKRNECQRAIAEGSVRRGKLQQVLSAGIPSGDLDSLKLQEQTLAARLDQAQRGLAKMLLAKQILESTMQSWESGSQASVLRKASRLLSVMTNGEWVRVAQGENGNLLVENRAGFDRDPLRLSLGTCQQLYLAMRIALLLVANDVGKSVPVIADDILESFDDERRRGAIRALAVLAEKRQIVLFTCHSDIVGLIQEAYENANILRL